MKYGILMASLLLSGAAHAETFVGSCEASSIGILSSEMTFELRQMGESTEINYIYADENDITVERENINGKLAYVSSLISLATFGPKTITGFESKTNACGGTRSKLTFTQKIRAIQDSAMTVEADLQCDATSFASACP